MIFYDNMSQSAPHTASVTQLCLHWCSAQLSAVLTFSPHWSQGLCVESDKALVGELGSASYFINWWCFISILTCACIGAMHIWELYQNLGTYAEVPVHISHTVCIIRFSSWYMYAGPSWIDCLMRQSPYKQILSSFATCEFVFKSFAEQITCENLLFVGSNQLIKIFVKFQLTSFWSCPPCQHANIYYSDSCVPLRSCQEWLGELEPLSHG